jgi:outer membrane protein OmpA-like peptidoglycan-associated protein
VKGIKDYFGCTEADSDNDGIPDGLDKCPNEPEDMDGYQDQDGCDDPDNDHDGIPDVLDQCVNQPETINGVQDDDGCPDSGDSSVMLMQDHIELIDGVDFAGDSATLKNSSMSVLEQVFATLRANPQIKVIQIQAYVDNRGSNASDLALSQKRGEAVKKYLLDKGVEPSRIDLKAFGSSKPKGKKRAQNDRIEFVITEQDKPGP